MKYLLTKLIFLSAACVGSFLLGRTHGFRAGVDCCNDVYKAKLAQLWDKAVQGEVEKQKREVFCNGVLIGCGTLLPDPEKYRDRPMDLCQDAWRSGEHTA